LGEEEGREMVRWRARLFTEGWENDEREASELEGVKGSSSHPRPEVHAIGAKRCASRRGWERKKVTDYSFVKPSSVKKRR
jgi:hypothetical protein